MSKTYTTDPAAYPEIERRVIAQYLAMSHQGRRGRISVRAIMEEVRRDLKIKVNNSDQTAITDRLLASNANLPIETRVRGTRGKNRIHPDVAVVASCLKTGVAIESVTFSSRSGQRLTVPIAKLRAFFGASK